MAVLEIANLLDELRRYQLVPEPSLQEFGQSEAASAGDVPGFLRLLLDRGLLTAFQVRELSAGNAGRLRLGPYRLLDPLGQGGMGQVFKARHDAVECDVALKLIRAERLENPDVVRQFLKEARATARLNHPNIVQALDSGEIGGTHYLAIEYLEGTDLGRLVKAAGPIPVGLACQCVCQASLGLQHAFEQGLVHRDIKPANLFLTRNGVVKVLDLGLARVSGLLNGQTNLTETGQFLGTPEYLAPEQALDPRDADIRSDLYSLGCTLYFLLVGRPPFQADTMARMLLEHQMKEAPPLTAGRPDAPPELDALLCRLLSKDPTRRPATPRELADALGPFCKAIDASTVSTLHHQATPLATLGLTPSPASTLPPTVTRSPLKRRRIRPGIAGLVAGLLGTLILLVVLLVGKNSRDEQNPDVAPSEKDVPNAAPAQIPAVIDRVVTLDAGDQPHVLDGVVEVKPRGVLRIKRGTTVHAMPGAKLIVRGCLETFGSDVELIDIRAGRRDQTWAGIQFRPGDAVIEHRVSNLRVRDAHVGIFFEEVPFQLERSIISECGTGVAIRSRVDGGDTLRNVLITRNSSTGITAQKGGIAISRCTLTHNGGAGLQLEEGAGAELEHCELAFNRVGVRTTDGEEFAQIKFCNVRNNTAAAVEINGNGTAGCVNCWWGMAKPDPLTLFLGGNKRPLHNKVTYHPYEPGPLEAGARVNPRAD